MACVNRGLNYGMVIGPSGFELVGHRLDGTYSPGAENQETYCCGTEATD
jgi:hypothetical protein